MPTTDELLEQMEAEVLSTSAENRFIVDNNLRTITVPGSITVLGVEHDDDVHRLYFQMPKMYGEFDLSEFDIRINYVNAADKPDTYPVDDKETSGDNITFSWLVGRTAFEKMGEVKFNVCLRKTNGDGVVVKEFNTTIATLPPVLEGLETTELIVQQNPDVIESILQRLGVLEENGGGGGTSDYSDLENKPQVNGIELVGNKTAEELGLQPKGDYLTSESDPTVPQWAKNPTKPSYTATEVGADASGTAVAKVSEHNTATDAHSDIRLLVQGLTTRLNTLADSDDDTLDQMSEIVAYIKSNKTLIDAITTQKVSVADIVDNLTTNVTNKPLSAAQGVALKALIDSIVIPETLPNPQKLKFTGAVTAEYDGSTEQTVNIPESTGGGSYTLPIMSDTQLGGGKAVKKTDEDVPVAVDPLTGQLFVPTYPENTGGDVVNVDAELKEYMNVAKPAIASAIINKGGSVEPDDSLNDYATRISAIPNDIYPAETLPVQTNLLASGLQDSVGIKLNWSDVNASGYLILRKENTMPATSADGDIVYNGTYAADGYTDTGVQKGKVYYYRIFPRNSKNQYQSLEDGAVAMVDYKDRTGQTLLGDLPLGSKIKFGQWNESDFFWEIVDTQDKASGFVTVAADQNLGSRHYDAPEKDSPISNRRTQGNNRWAYSAVRQLLNSDQDTGAWWSAQYEYDAAPSYATQIPGFLKDFTTYEKGIVVTKTNKCILPNADGGGTETVQDKFWFPSYYAMGLGVIQPLEDDHIYEKFTDNKSRSYQSNYWLRSINGAESPSSVRLVNSNGSASNVTANSYYAVRPFCHLPVSAYVSWSVSDDAYIFVDDNNRDIKIN